MCSVCDSYGINLHLAGGDLDRSDVNLDPYAGLDTYRGKPILDQDGVIDQITTGRSQDVNDGVITFGFFDHTHAVGRNNDPHYGEGFGYSPMTEEQRDAARDAIELWDDLIPASFVEVEPAPGASSWAQNSVDIWLANTTTGPAQAWAYYPSSSTNPSVRVPGDVWIANPDSNSSNGELAFGQYGRTTLVHELGHSLGLPHPGDYNFGQDSDGDGVADPLTYTNFAEYAQDSQQYSIMSYWGGWETGAAPIDWLYSGGIFYDNSPQGPMLHDILAVQSVYGADPTTRADATTYGFNSNAGNAMYDFNENPLPYYALYDAGGEDTIDLSGFQSSQYLNLTPGVFSSIGEVPMTNAEIGQLYHDIYLELTGFDYFSIGYTASTLGGAVLNLHMTRNAADLASDTGVAGIRTVNYENFAIAYETIIENAVGGQGRDLLVGNHVDNVLDGQGGDDVIKGGAGDDMLIGGLGNDTLYGEAGADTLVFANDGSLDTIVGFETGVDTIDLSAVEGATADTVSYDAIAQQVQIDTDSDGTADMFINVANTVGTEDYIFYA